MTGSIASPAEDTPLEKQQRASAQLRQGFLRAIQELSDAKCTIFTYEKTALDAEFVGWHTNGQELLVRNLKTPSGEVMPTAKLRAPDILYIEFDKSIENVQP